MLGIALSSTAAADPPPTDHEKAVELFEDGRRLMNSHDPVGACAKFSESIRLEPLAAGTMLNLGLCHEQRGRYKTALYWFRKAQARAVETEPPLPAYEQEAREHTTHLATIVPTIRIVVPAKAPEDTQVTLDDDVVRPEDYARLEIDPGHHVIVASAEGKDDFKKELDITGRGGQVIKVSFEHGPAAEAGQPPTDTPRHVDVHDTVGQQKRIALYVGASGGALLATSLALTLYEKHVYNNNKDAAQHGDLSALDATKSATDVARNYGTGLAVAGLIAGGVAAYLFVTAHDERAIVAPAVAPDHVGAVVTGWF